MLILAIVASLPATVAIAAPQDPPAQVQVRFPLRHLRGFTVQPDVPPLGSQLEESIGRGYPSPALFDASRPPSGLTIDQILDMVGVGCRIWENDDLKLDVHHGILFATGSATDIKGVERTLAVIEQHLTAEIDVELHLVPWTSEQPPPARLDPAATDAFLAAHTPTWSGRSRLRAGDLRTLGHTTWTPYVRDCETEAAQESTISRPHVSTFFEGLSLTLEVHTLSQPGVLTMLGQFAHAELAGPMATALTGVKKMPALDIPVLNTASGTFSGRFDSDGALVLGFGGSEPGPQVAILLRAKHSAAGEADGDGPRFLPISALTTRSLAMEPDEDLRFRSSMADRLDSIAGSPAIAFATEHEFSLEPLSPDVIGELVRIRHPALEDDDGVTMVVVPQGLFVFGDPRLGEQIGEFVAALEDRHLTSSTVNFAVGGSGQPEWWVTAPALHDRRHCLFSGRDTTVIGAYNSDISAGAARNSPIVRNLFSGIAVNFAIHSGGRQPTLDLRGWVSIASEPTRRPSQSVDTGYLQLPQEARTTVHCLRSFAAGSPIDLGDGPVRPWVPVQVRTPTTISVTVQ